MEEKVFVAMFPQFAESRAEGKWTLVMFDSACPQCKDPYQDITATVAVIRGMKLTVVPSRRRS